MIFVGIFGLQTLHAVTARYGFSQFYQYFWLTNVACCISLVDALPQRGNHGIICSVS